MPKDDGEERCVRRSLDASDSDGDDAYESDCAYRGVKSPGLLSNRFLVCVL